MLAATKIYDTLEQELNRPLVSFANAAVDSLTAYITAPMKVALVLFVVTFGVTVLLGKTDKPLGEFVLRALKFSFVLIVLDAGWYKEHVTQFVMVQLPNELAGAITSNGAIAQGSSFDQLYDYGHGLAALAWSKASVTSPGGYLHWGVVMAITGLFCSVGFFIVTYAKISLALLIAIGPLFVATFVFAQSRPIGEAWIKTLVSFVCLHVLAAGLGALVIHVAYASFATTTTQELPARVGSFLAISFVGMLTFGALPHIAQMLGGAGTGFAHAAGGAAQLAAGSAWAGGRAAVAAAMSGGGSSGGAGATTARAQAAFISSPQGRAMNEQTAAIQEQAAALRDLQQKMTA